MQNSYGKIKYKHIPQRNEEWTKVKMSNLNAHDTAILNSVFNPHLPLNILNAEPSDLEDTTDESVPKSRAMEIEAIKLAEEGNLERAIDILTTALEVAPKRPSIHNNRAHCYLFLKEIPKALDDLNQAISLAQGTEMKKSLAQAYNQRGVIYKSLENEEQARSDFEKSARLGSQFAKNQLVEMNPYAALCNQMLRKVMDTM